MGRLETAQQFQPQMGPNGQALAASPQNEPGSPYSIDTIRSPTPPPQPTTTAFPRTGTGPTTNVERYVMNKAQMDAARGQPIVAPRLARQP